MSAINSYFSWPHFTVVVHFGVFSFVKRKGKFGAVHILKAYRGVVYTLPLIVCSAVDVVSGHVHAPPPVPL
jgi:hypothetical protein